jgi:hypothetical protein
VLTNAIQGVAMKPINVTLHLNQELYEKYREFCKKNGLMVSRQIELFMEAQMKKREKQ